jgi:hypothetical protein
MPPPQPILPQQPSRTAAQHLTAFRALLTSATIQAREGLQAFWKDVRQSLNDQDAIIAQQAALIQQLQLQIAQPAPITPARPTTSNSVHVIRDTIDQALQQSGLYFEDASATIEEIYNLDPTWVVDFLRRQKNHLISNANELGCWLSGNAQVHDSGYVKINLRGTLMPGTNQKFSVQPFGHQLAAVASSGSSIEAITDGRWQVINTTIQGSIIVKVTP